MITEVELGDILKETAVACFDVLAVLAKTEETRGDNKYSKLVYLINTSAA
jgi:hypothetical protein